MRLAKLLSATLILGVLLSGCTSKSDPEREIQTVAVNINHSTFDPTGFEFEAGTTVRFVIHNADPIDHEFILGDETVQLVHENGTEKKHGAKPGEVSIPAGETRTTTYTFGEPEDLIAGCHLPRHYDYGMRADVTVIS
jgi:uncharacterized cupredoxin-like copper-binding protein